MNTITIFEVVKNDLNKKEFIVMGTEDKKLAQDFVSLLLKKEATDWLVVVIGRNIVMVLC